MGHFSTRNGQLCGLSPQRFLILTSFLVSDHSVTNPIKILQRKLYATIFFQAFDWMLKNSTNQNAQKESIVKFSL